MNGNPQTDRLSAYYDNQLPLDERALVEQELAASREMRQELSEYGQISKLLQAQPQLSAPIELHSSILRAIERESLLPVADTARPRRLGRLLITVSAACALAAIGYFAMQSQNGNQVAKDDGQKPAIVHGHRDGSTRQANKIQQDKLQFSHDELQNAQVGDVINAVTKSGDTVSVIRLTVVGREPGIDELRVLLAGGGDATGIKSSDGLMAVYLQADPQRLSADLTKVLSKFELESMSVSEPVAIEKLDAEQQKLIVDAKQNHAATMTVKPDSELDKAIKGEAANKLPASKASSGPARVIFVFLNGSKNDPNVM